MAKYYLDGIIRLIEKSSEGLADERERKKFLLDLCFNPKNPFYEQICLDLMANGNCKTMAEAEKFDKEELKGLINLYICS